MRVGIVGAGIVGLTLARELRRTDPGGEVTVFEKERDVGRHQTSHNSGVVHAGLYYAPDSLKARLCARGRDQLIDYCRANGVRYKESGKLVVAVTADEIAGLREIQRRAEANRVPGLRWLTGAAAREIEPHVRAVAALHSPHTGVVDFAAVAAAVATDVRRGGGLVKLGCPVTAVTRSNGRLQVTAGGERHTYDRLVLCAGLQADRVSRLAGGEKDPAIVPFTGMYYRLVAGRRDLVRSLIYPVPDPRYPFLGVHLTRTVRDDVLIGPNALLALAREGYRPLRANARDVGALLGWPGFHRLARRHWRAGAGEVLAALSRHRFMTAARRYVPDLDDRDVVRAWTGVRAQAVWRNGDLADDFALIDAGGVLSVRNAPSPAATSSFAIAEYLARRVVHT